MKKIQPEQFGEFFQALYPYPPMNWQIELAEAACKGEWPGYICLPTGAGKTSAIDIALFALAFQSNLPPEERTAAMRTFLVLDRRTVVSEAFCRAKNLQHELTQAQEGVLKTVADCLRSYTDGSSEPVSVVELRGGVYRDPGWCHSATQPMIITSTVDQVGSRLLFRGYGVSRSSRPVQAAVVAHDSLIILDEAHISAPFSQTLQSVSRFQKQPWSSQQVPLPMRVVEMTATPPQDSTSSRLEIDPAELDDASTHIGNIVNTGKVATLEVAEKVKGANAPKQLATILVERAIGSLELPLVPTKETDSERPDSAPQGAEQNNEADSKKTTGPKVIGIMCNMVATAKATYELLLKNKKVNDDQVHLIIGAMRPCDRDQQTNQLREIISTGSNRDQIDEPIFVVATQCIEVGADYDFDVLVTEAAPLSSLIQRFGRLNRAGRPINAVAYVIMRGDRVKTEKQLNDDDKSFNYVDPIYGNAMSRTWNWLEAKASASEIDFGIAAMTKLVHEIPTDSREQMSVNQTDAPVLMPGHLDLLCQTSIDPWPDPDVALWLHGPQRIDPEVQVCWRADLVNVANKPGSEQEGIEIVVPNLINERAVHTVSLCPPTSYESLSVPMRRVIAWLNAESKQKRTPADLSGDLPSMSEDAEVRDESLPRHLQPVAWRGLGPGLEKSQVITSVIDIRPGDTLVFPVTSGGWTELGFIRDCNGWLPQTVEKVDLPKALSHAAHASPNTVMCKTDDFERLTKIDCGNVAFSQSRNRPIVRLHPALVDTPTTRNLYQDLNKPDFKITKSELKELIEALPEGTAGGGFEETSPSQIRYEFYLGQNGGSTGIVVTGPRKPGAAAVPVPDDDGTDIYSQISAGDPVELSMHLEHVCKELKDSLKQLPLADFRNTLLRAAETHDWGKADARFQAMLLGGDLYAALWEDHLYAKSSSMPGNLAERNSARKRSELPSSFRHEFLSVSLVESQGVEDAKVEDSELLLHLIATHHGHARPWAPVCDDPEPVDVSLKNIGLPSIGLSAADRNAICYHKINSPLVSRFWRTVRKYGWWEAAFLESILRFADRRASQIESQNQNRSTPSEKHQLSETGVAS